jgi:ketosteroid isomerase-like protein
MQWLPATILGMNLRMKWLLAVPPVAALALAWYAQLHTNENEIRKIRTESNHAIAHGDIAAFAASLTDDFIMVRGSSAFASRQQYIAAFSDDFRQSDAVRYERITDRVELSKAAPLAAEHGHWIGHNARGRAVYGGTYLAMWRHTDSGWKIRSELFVVLTCADPAACSAYRATAPAK